MLELYSKELNRFPVPTPKQESEALQKFVRFKTGRKKQEAKDFLIKSNLRLVIKIAREYSKFGLPIEDLISEGCIGLARAIELFKKDKNVKFSYYASLWIKQSITRALSNKSKTIRIPHGLVNQYGKAKRCLDSLTDKLGRAPTYKELSIETNILPKKLKKILLFLPKTISLHQPIKSTEECSIEEILPDTLNGNALEELLEKEDLNNLKNFLNSLTDREFYVLAHRFGLEDEDRETLEKIGNTYELTRERIRQIEKEAIGKLKKMFDKKGVNR